VIAAVAYHWYGKVSKVITPALDYGTVGSCDVKEPTKDGCLCQTLIYFVHYLNSVAIHLPQITEIECLYD